MNAYASQLLLPFVVAAFVVFAAASALATSAFRQGRVAAGREVLGAVWLFGAVAVAVFGYGQYGLRIVLPAVLAVGISVVGVYAITRNGSRQFNWFFAAARCSVAAILATALLPVSLLLLLMLFGIDGP